MAYIVMAPYRYGLYSYGHIYAVVALLGGEAAEGLYSYGPIQFMAYIVMVTFTQS